MQGEIRRFATRARTLDLGCGNAPVADGFPHRVGMDILDASGVDVIADAHFGAGRRAFAAPRTTGSGRALRLSGPRDSHEAGRDDTGRWSFRCDRLNAKGEAGPPGHPGLPRGRWEAHDGERRATMILGRQCAAELAPGDRERQARDTLL